ncbi:hypothetical protein NDU88_002832 [Pleurodeles waltl]|uniref:Myb/SANT-like DNA-binding domain-containing protein n=1 Tax=Pleurodeles waltl TaxID=8319 RepID=A0AAV7SF49_PLEWA|nr:hypothetical protein NDU88_002832 [Pleurodeles waltl]
MSSSQELGDSVGNRKTGKRPRKPNYTYEELQLLIHTVHHNYDLLYGEGQRKNDQRRKEVWHRLVESINGQGVVVRTKDELQHKYRDLRAEVKKKLHEIQRQSQGGGDGMPISVSLTLLEKLIAANINRGFQQLHCSLPGEHKPQSEQADRVEGSASTPGLEIEGGIVKEEEFEENTSQDVQDEESRLLAPPSWFLDYERVPTMGQDAQDTSVDLSDSMLDKKRTQPDGKPVDSGIDCVSRDPEDAARAAPTTPASTSTVSDADVSRGWSQSQPTEHASWRLTLRRLYELEERRELRHQQQMQMQKQHVQLQQDILEQQKAILQTIQSCMQLQVEQQERHHQDLLSILRSQHTTTGVASPSGCAKLPGPRTPGTSSKITIVSSPPHQGAHKGQLSTASLEKETPNVATHVFPQETLETAQKVSAARRGRGRRGRGRPRGAKSKKS